MPNFPGAKLYPYYPTGPTAMLDDGLRIKQREVTIPRGGTAEDFNIRLRGASRRVDKKPELTYP